MVNSKVAEAGISYRERTGEKERENERKREGGREREREGEGAGFGCIYAFRFSSISSEEWEEKWPSSKRFWKLAVQPPPPPLLLLVGAVFLLLSGPFLAEGEAGVHGEDAALPWDFPTMGPFTKKDPTIWGYFFRVPKIRVPYFGVLTIRNLLFWVNFFRVPLSSETPTWPHRGHPQVPGLQHLSFLGTVLP